MCLHLCRLDVAICLRKRKNEFHVLEGKEGNFIGVRLGVTASVFGLKSTTVTKLVSQTEGKYHISHMDCCHAIKLVTYSATKETRANHFLQTDDTVETALGLHQHLSPNEIAPEYYSSTSRYKFHQCFSLISTVFTSTPSLNHLSSSLILTSFVLFCLFLIRPLSAKVQSSRPYDLHHWPVLSCHSYQNWTAICAGMSAESPSEIHGGKEGDLVLRESKQLLPQPVSSLHGPLLGQELLDRVSALEELVAVAPDGVWGVCELSEKSA